MHRRPRRNRKSESIRKLVQSNKVTADDLVLPLFLLDGENINQQVPSLPIASKYSLDRLLPFIAENVDLGIHSFIMFPGVDSKHKDKTGSYGYDPDNFYLKAATKIKAQFPEITLISDVALDPYSIDGHDGIVKGGKILNDDTLEILAKMSVAQAEAGFDMLGPSDMMDGRIGFIREALDDAGHTDTSIMSYTAKYASAFYGPFRDALDSAPVEDENIPSNKKSYQMDPANHKEAIMEAEQDYIEGADIMMVKPALNYLDVILSLKQNFDIPIAAYHVSGECAMLIAAAEKGWLDLDQAAAETTLSIKRAGADIIITYFASIIASKMS